MADPREVGDPKIVEALHGVLNQVPNEFDDDAMSAWEQQILAFSDSPQLFLSVLTERMTNPPYKTLSVQELNEDPTIERNRELQVNVLTVAAQERGATEFDLKCVVLDTTEPEKRQEIFDMMRDDGLDGVTYEQVGKLIKKYDLEWW